MTFEHSSASGDRFDPAHDMSIDMDIPNSNYINSAFRSSRMNEVYFFIYDKYMRLYYTPGQTQTNDQVLIDLRNIDDDFASLHGTHFGAYGINCSFDTEGNKAYIFSDKICAYIDYVNDKILSLKGIGDMFPVLEDTVFENGIDSAFKSSRGKEVYLFQGNKYCCMDYDSKQLVEPIRNITDGFPLMKDTMFEDGIDPSFASHNENQAYLFKGENYVLINFIPGTTQHTFMDVVKPIVDGWSSFRDILPFNDTSVDLGPMSWCCYDSPSGEEHCYDSPSDEEHDVL
ncbi:hypothetical protein VNO80_14163 [Phaseolus coccineus]|uniref:Uncharacterized protein n=1 Tax=Phaseolus coccineus TaxID=3886 RepID=A0AAN9R152_PHACN